MTLVVRKDTYKTQLELNFLVTAVKLAIIFLVTADELVIFVKFFC